MKKRLFFTCLAFKGLLLEITLANKTKNNFKKNFFFLFGQQSNASKKKTKCLVCLCLSFKTSLRITEVQHLLLFFRTSNQKVVLCTNEKLFFLYFSFTRKQSSQQTHCFFFVNKTILKWETETKQKKKLNWSFCFFVDSFCLLPPQAKQKNALLQKWGDNSEDNTLALFEVWKTFLSLHCCFFLS